MIKRVIIEVQDDYDSPELCRATVEKSLQSKGVERVAIEDNDIVAYMPDCHDAEETVVNALNEAGIEAYVYTV